MINNRWKMIGLFHNRTVDGLSVVVVCIHCRSHYEDTTKRNPKSLGTLTPEHGS
jgi:hypothetical protein